MQFLPFHVMSPGIGVHTSIDVGTREAARRWYSAAQARVRATNAFVRGKDGRLHLMRTAKDTFGVKEWLAADADAREAADGSLADGVFGVMHFMERFDAIPYLLGACW